MGKPTATAEDCARSGQSDRVLVIEPSRVYRNVLESVVRGYGLQPVSVSGFHAAEALLGDGEFGMICLNYHLPEMSGMEASHQLRKRPALSTTPIVMLTSETDDELLHSCYEAGVTEVFSKSRLGKFQAYLQRFVDAGAASRLLRGHVLYVEDGKVAASVTKKWLRHLGLTYDHFENATDALAAAISTDYELVITDVVLDGAMSGTQLVRAIRELPEPKGSVPVLAMTALDDKSRRVELFRGGVSDLVRKPALLEEFGARVTSLVTGRRLRAKLAAQQAQLRDLSVTDRLTSVSDRRHLVETGLAQLPTWQADGRPVGLVVCSVDNFRQVNEVHGLECGDEVLVDVADLLRSVAGRDDLAARIGSAQFALLVPGLGAGAAAELAEALRGAVVTAQPGGCATTVSLGVASASPRFAGGFDPLFLAAEAACQRATAAGGDQLVTVTLDGEAGQPAVDAAGGSAH